MSSSPAPASSKGTAVVTGASSGIGKVYAQRLAARGHDVLLVARRADRLQALAEAIGREHGVRAEVLAADLADPADLARVARRLEEDASVTMLVNNAGTAIDRRIAEADVASLESLNAINVDALVRLSRAVLPGFRARNSGTLVNIGSVLGFHSLPTSGAYSATKSFVLTFTRALQDEFADTGVVVQLVAPAATATDIWEHAGTSVDAMDPATVMSVDDLVDAALAGLDQGEKITLPSLEDPQLFIDYDNARLRMMGSVLSGKPASRYGIGR